MKFIQTFEHHNENYKNKLVSLIKKHITNVVALQSGFRDDVDDHFIEYSSYKDMFNHFEYITMFDKDDVLVEPYYSYLGEDEKHYDRERKTYDVKYEDLDIEILEKIKEMIFLGHHLKI